MVVKSDLIHLAKVLAGWFGIVFLAVIVVYCYNDVS
jgi:hypothetical protein